MVVGHGQVHHRTSHDLVTNAYRTVNYCVHTEDSALRWVDDRGSRKRAENSSVGNSEIATQHVFNSDFAITSLIGQVS